MPWLLGTAYVKADPVHIVEVRGPAVPERKNAKAAPFPASCRRQPGLFYLENVETGQTAVRSTPQAGSSVGQRQWRGPICHEGCFETEKNVRNDEMGKVDKKKETRRGESKAKLATARA